MPGCNVLSATLLSVPIVDAAHERRDESHAGFGASDCLGEAEQQREVAVNAFALQLFRGANAFPGTGNLYEDTLTDDAGVIIQSNEPMSLGDGAVGVEAQ